MSSYRKLRLDRREVLAGLAGRGLEVEERPRASGMVTVLARRAG